MRKEQHMATAHAAPAARCAAVRLVVEELHRLAAHPVSAPSRRRRPAAPAGRELRRPYCHLRQIAMYVCHVALSMSLTEIGLGFGRDRTTVSHACRVVEDRRDDPAYDRFVEAVERIAAAVLGAPGREGQDG